MSTRRGGSGTIALERRLRELELELSAAHQRSSGVLNRHQKSERHYKELELRLEDGRKNQGQMTSMVEKLNSKLKSYKDQITEAEEIAALNLAKYRKAQQQLEEAECRSRLAENQLAVCKSNSVEKYHRKY
jgi:chromosome segregation ATPase